MGKADTIGGENYAKMCPRCQAVLQTSRKRVKCSCGHYVRPMDMGEVAEEYYTLTQKGEAIDALKQRVRDFIEGARKGER